MKPPAWFSILLSVCALALGCDPASDDDSGGGDSGAVQTTASSSGGESSTEGDTGPSPDDGESGATVSCLDEKIGVPECDRYLDDYLLCIDEAVPKDEQEAELDGLETTCEEWREAAQTDAGAKGLYETCTDAWIEAAKGCGWMLGSCEGACETTAAVPDGLGGCYCSEGCIDLGDCCDDYEEVCKAGQAGLGDALPVTQASSGHLDWAEAQWRWPSTRHYPDLASTLLPALQGQDDVAIVAAIAESFAGSKWSSLRDWDRFGAIELERGFVSADDGEQQSGFSLGCLGGMLEVVRLLVAPHALLDGVLAPLEQCPYAATGGSCSDEAHTGLHVLAHLRDDHLPTWQLELVENSGTRSLREYFEASMEPYFVGASHVSRRDRARRFHHMLVVIVDDDAAIRGPVVFDVTGLRGASARRMSWRRLSRYLGGALADSRGFRYDDHSTTLAVLRGPG